MSFAEYDASRDAGQIVETYLFRYGLGPSDYYAFTDGERVISEGGIDYDPVPIDRGRLRADGGRERRDLTITVSALSPIPNMFLIYPPDYAISVIIRATHLNDPAGEFVPVWAGRVSNVKWDADNGKVDLVCRPLAAASRQGGLRRHWQIGCPHVLFGGQCLANEVAATISTTAIGVQTNKVTVAGGWNTSPVIKYLGGKVSWQIGANTTRRSILRIEADERTLVLSGPTTGMQVGDSLDVSLGCNRTMDDCLVLHDNIHNFGGDPWIPLVNPVNTNPYV